MPFLLPLMPAAPKESEYVEPFMGGAAVALNRKHKAKRVYLNDINGEVVNFFMVLRDNPDMLIQQLSYTPYSEYEHRRAFECKFDAAAMPDVEAARLFGVKIFQSYSSIVGENGSGWKPGLLAFNDNRIATFKDVAKIIRKFLFHNDDALSVIKRHNKPSVFIYADPPYLMETRTHKGGYIDELANERDYHIRLLELATQSQAQFAISGYHSPLYDEALADWHCFENETYAYAAPMMIDETLPTRTDVLWCNYNPAELGGQSVLF